jgi:hypothetical protein
LLRDKNQIEQELQRCFRELREIALEDKEITSEEEAILNKIETDFTHLEEQLIQVLESNLDEEEFQELIREFLGSITENAYKIAYKDGIITLDEQKLLAKIKDFTSRGGIN